MLASFKEKGFKLYAKPLDKNKYFKVVYFYKFEIGCIAGKAVDF